MARRTEVQSLKLTIAKLDGIIAFIALGWLLDDLDDHGKPWWLDLLGFVVFAGLAIVEYRESRPAKTPAPPIVGTEQGDYS